MNSQPDDDLRNAERQRTHHVNMAAKTFGAERDHHLGLVDEAETRISAIRSRMAKRKRST
jgi:hypothetical protein